jgi:hypothetical protein
MILRALHSGGKLDISSQETHRDKGASGEDFLQFRLTLVPDQTVTVDDRYRRLKNIDQAINAGLLEVVSLDSDVTSTFIHGEATAGEGLDAATISLDSGETVTLDCVSITEYRTVKWFVSITDGTNGTYKSTEVFAQHDGTTAISNEFSMLGDASVTFCVDVVGGKMRLRVTATEDDQTVKSERISIDI